MKTGSFPGLFYNFYSRRDAEAQREENFSKAAPDSFIADSEMPHFWFWLSRQAAPRWKKTPFPASSLRLLAVELNLHVVLSTITIRQIPEPVVNFPPRRSQKILVDQGIFQIYQETGLGRTNFRCIVEGDEQGGRFLSIRPYFAFTFGKCQPDDFQLVFANQLFIGKTNPPTHTTGKEQDPHRQQDGEELP
jgi:hypothetical protein